MPCRADCGAAAGPRRLLRSASRSWSGWPGRVVEKIERKKVGGRTVEKVKEETVGGILHWGRENDDRSRLVPEGDSQGAWWSRAQGAGPVRRRRRDPVGGDAPRLRGDRDGHQPGRLVHPQVHAGLPAERLAGQTRPLCPHSRFRTAISWKPSSRSKGFKGAGLRTMLERLGHGDGGEIQLDALPHDDPTFEADLAWHVRAWGRRVLARARRDLAACYPTLCRVRGPEAGHGASSEGRCGFLTWTGTDVPQLDPLNAGFDRRLAEGSAEPSMGGEAGGRLSVGAHGAVQGLPGDAAVAQDALAVQEGQQARPAHRDAECGSDWGRVRHRDQPTPGSVNNAAQRREHDKRIGAGTMSRSGASCPCCPAIMTTEDIRHEARAGRLGHEMTAVVTGGVHGKEYRLPTVA